MTEQEGKVIKKITQIYAFAILFSLIFFLFLIFLSMARYQRE